MRSLTTQLPDARHRAQEPSEEPQHDWRAKNAISPVLVGIWQVLLGYFNIIAICNCSN